MKITTLSAGMLILLSACEPAAPNACERAQTYGEMFGTPDDKGPCWGAVISEGHTGNIQTYMIEMPLPGYTIGTVTYEGNTLIQAGITSG